MNIRKLYINILLYIKHIGRSFFEIITDKEICINCGKKTSQIPLCKDCQQSFIENIFSKQKRCLYCGTKLISEIDICMECRMEKKVPHCEKIFPLSSYRSWKKNLILDWKFNEKRALSVFFASCINIALEKQGWKKLPIVPVPPRKNKIKEKGWDQIEELCTILECKYLCKVIRMLKKDSNIIQKKLNSEMRKENVKNAYSIRKLFYKKNAQIPKEVVIIDDVMTTGSTLESCAKVLSDYGIEKIYAIVLFNVN